MGHAVYASEGVDYDDDLRCPFNSVEEVLAFDPWEAYGEIDGQEYTRRFEQQYRRNCENYPDNVNMTGIYPSLITGLTFIFGWELLLLTAGLDPDGFGALVNRYGSWIQQHYDALGDADVPVIYSHDDMVWTQGAIFRPDWYRKYVFPNLERFWDPLLRTGKKVLFVCDGNYTQFVDDIAACGASGFWFEIFTDLETIAKRYGQTHFMIGNVDTRVLLSGSKEAIRAEVERCLDIGKPCPGYFMAVSNHLPPNTPVESAIYYNQVYEEMMWR
jgi:uroporphyrinogen-III decarboxylase